MLTFTLFPFICGNLAKNMLTFSSGCELFIKTAFPVITVEIFPGPNGGVNTLALPCLPVSLSVLMEYKLSHFSQSIVMYIRRLSVRQAREMHYESEALVSVFHWFLLKLHIISFWRKNQNEFFYNFRGITQYQKTQTLRGYYVLTVDICPCCHGGTVEGTYSPSNPTIN